MSNKQEPKGVRIDSGLIKSKAFLSLKTKGSPQAYMVFLYKRQWAKTKANGRTGWVCTNNGRIQFSYREAASYGWSSKQFSKILDELVMTGLLDVGYVGGQRRYDPSLYRLSERWCNYGTTYFSKVSRRKDTVQRGWRKPRRPAPPHGLTAKAFAEAVMVLVMGGMDDPGMADRAFLTLSKRKPLYTSISVSDVRLQ